METMDSKRLKEEFDARIAEQNEVVSEFVVEDDVVDVPDDFPKLNEVARNGDFILYEIDPTGCDDVFPAPGVSLRLLQEYFPDFDFREDKEYYIGNINGGTLCGEF